MTIMMLIRRHWQGNWILAITEWCVRIPARRHNLPFAFVVECIYLHSPNSVNICDGNCNSWWSWKLSWKHRNAPRAFLDPLCLHHSALRKGCVPWDGFCFTLSAPESMPAIALTCLHQKFLYLFHTDNCESWKPDGGRLLSSHSWWVF